MELTWVVAESAPPFALPDLTRVLLAGAIVLILAVIAVRVSMRSIMPTLLLYIGIGVALGESGLGVTFDSPHLAEVLGYAALILILAEGGLTTSWSTMKRAIAPAAVLSTVGVVVSVLVVGVAAHHLLGLSWSMAFLIGAILASTDAAAVFSVLRTVPLPRRLTGLLEAESGFNDAPVVLLTIALAHRLVVGADQNPMWMLALSAAVELIGGAVIGLVIGVGGGWAMRRLAGSSSTMFAIGLLALAVLAYAVADTAHTSGFIATYLCALVLGNARLPHRQAVYGFAQAVGWLAQIGLFVMLGILASPSRLDEQVVPALIIGAVLLLVARPLSVLVSLTPFRVPWRDQLFLSWAGLRGAVPVVLATVPQTVDTPGVDTRWIFDLVLMLVLIYTMVQATTLAWVSKALKVTAPAHARTVNLEATALEDIGAEVLQVSVGPDSRLHGVEIFELRLPRKAQVTLLVRDGETIVPHRTTPLHHGDEMLIVVPASARLATEQRLVQVSEQGRLAGWPVARRRPSS